MINISEEENESLSWQNFENGCQELAKKIKDSGIVFNSIGTFSRGGFPIACCLSHLLDIEKIDVIKEEDTSATKDCLVVDDISDTGKTLHHAKILGYTHFATLHWHSQSIVKPTWYVWEKKDAWIVYPWEV